MLSNYEVLIIEKIIQQVMYYNNEPILKYEIRYPRIFSDKYQGFLNKLNLYYETKAVAYEKHLTTKLYQMAKKDYEYSMLNGFPVRSYEAFTNYNVALNYNCLISLYFDQYEYTGGAHGSTIRYSDSWDLLRSKQIILREMFPYYINYREYIITTIETQIAKQIENGSNIYFENYQELIQKYFNEDRFYLIPEGIVIYFLQYEIAPYSSGIPTFTIPYSDNILMPPTCKK